MWVFFFSEDLHVINDVSISCLLTYSSTLIKWIIYLWMCVCVCVCVRLSVQLSLCMCVYLPVSVYMYLCICLSAFLSICLSACLIVFLSGICVSVLPACPPACPPVRLLSFISFVYTVTWARQPVPTLPGIWPSTLYLHQLNTQQQVCSPSTQSAKPCQSTCQTHTVLSISEGLTEDTNNHSLVTAAE